MTLLDECLTGRRLYGDDFSPQQIAAWFEEEREGYAGLGPGDRGRYRYSYHALNRLYGYRVLDPRRQYRSALGVGSAYGDELLPLVGRVRQITILEPSDTFAGETAAGIPCEYARSRPDGRLPFADGRFDFVRCLSVLHHIPNVSTVVRELARCTAPGADLLIREPVMSMGDWTRPRAGLTRNERGIPRTLLRRMLVESGFRVVRETPCGFRPAARAFALLGVAAGNSAAAVRLDVALSIAFRWNNRYHAARPWHRFRPDSVFFVLRRL